MKNDEEKLSSIADAGNELNTLIALRHKLAVTIDNSTSGRDIAALSKQLRDCITRISELQAEQSNTSDDLKEIISRHADFTVRAAK